VLKAEAPSPRQYDAAIPEILAKVALRALAHDPARRFANGTEAAAALKEAWESALANGTIPVSAFATTSARPRQTSTEPPTVVDAPPTGAKLGPPPVTRPAPSPPAAAGKAGRPPLPKPAPPKSPAAAKSDGSKLAAPLPEPRGLFQQAAAEGEAAAEDDAAFETKPVVRASSARPRDDEPKVIKTGPIDVSHLRKPQTPQPQHDGRFWIYFAIMMVALVAGAVLAFLYVRGS
jgi:hypothetical protein